MPIKSPKSEIREMTKAYIQRLRQLEDVGSGIFAGGLRGLEKESLRVNKEGRLVQTEHPHLLGSPLTHPYITTDFSEAQLEFVTPPYTNTQEVTQFLTELHQFAVSAMDKSSEKASKELIWPSSMPCHVMNEEMVPVANFGSSNVGQMKHVYRLGLGERYGRIMQTISGVHYNFSIPERFWPVYQELELCELGKRNEEFISAQYFHMLRNLRRVSWLSLYLFGCSPAFCSSFNISSEGLEKLNHSYYLPYATSLRMSDIGYKNKSQDSIHVSSNSLDDYVRDISAALSTSFNSYEDIGVKVDGKYKQLNANLLQIENEYYSSVRPKRTARSGEKPSHALQRAGVQYLEFRALDLNIFDPIGVNHDELYFMEILMWYCLFYPSPKLTLEAEQMYSNNQLLTSREGRKPDLNLMHFHQERNLREWATAICRDMEPLAELMDKDRGDTEKEVYVQALSRQLAKIIDADLTPSAKVISEMQRSDVSFHGLTLSLAEQHTAYFRALHLQSKRANLFERFAEKSHQKQRELERSDMVSFDEYLADYFAK